MSKYLLIEELATKRAKKPVYYAGQTAIGPMCTRDLAEAETFDSLESAQQCPAMLHTLSFFKPVEYTESTD